MGGASLRSHPKGLTPSHVQKQEPDMADIDYVHSGSPRWLGRVLAPRDVLMTLVSMPLKM